MTLIIFRYLLQGVDATTLTGSAPGAPPPPGPTPPPGPPPPAAPAPSGGDGQDASRAALFAEINRGGDVTKGD